MFEILVSWMEKSWIGAAGRDVYWLFPAAEILHFLGFAFCWAQL